MLKFEVIFSLCVVSQRKLSIGRSFGSNNDGIGNSFNDGVSVAFLVYTCIPAVMSLKLDGGHIGRGSDILKL